MLNSLLPTTYNTRINGLEKFIGSNFLDEFFYDTLDNNYFHGWKETADAYIFECPLAGFKKEEVKINLNGRKLSIHASNKRNNRENRFYKEYYTDGLYYFDPEKATAHLEDGVLTITLPKTERAKGREIKVS